MFVPKEEVWAGMFGMWLSGEDQPVEFIFYNSQASPSHRVHIQLHELAHILMGHSTLKVPTRMAGQVAKGTMAPELLKQNSAA